MIFKLSVIFLFKFLIVCANVNEKQGNNIKHEKEIVIELTDEKWDVVQKGQWLVGL